jgi:hypothetical protein
VKVAHKFSFELESDEWPDQPWPWRTKDKKKLMRPTLLRFGITVTPSVHGPLTEVSATPVATGPRINKDGNEGASVSLHWYTWSERPEFVEDAIRDAVKSAWVYLSESAYSYEALAQSYRK